MVVIPPTPAPVASASCLDRFCQMKSLHRATLPAVKRHFSHISAFLTDFGSQSTAMLGWGRVGEALEEARGVAGYPSMGHPAWDSRHHCLVLWLVSEDKTLLPVLQPVKAAPAAPFCLSWAGDDSPAATAGERMLQGFGSSHQSLLLPPSPGRGLGVPPVPLAPATAAHAAALGSQPGCTAGICSAVLVAGCKPATPGEAKCT